MTKILSESEFVNSKNNFNLIDRLTADLIAQNLSGANPETIQETAQLICELIEAKHGQQFSSDQLCLEFSSQGDFLCHSQCH